MRGDAGGADIPTRATVRGSGLFARALAGDEVVYAVRGPILDREPEGPQLVELRILGGRQGSLALTGLVVPQLRGDMDGGLGRGFAGEQLEGQDETGAGNGRRVGHGSTLEIRLVEELGHEAGVIRA